MDNGIIAKAMDADIRTVRAYSTLEDTMETEAKEETKFPDRKFQDVMRKEVENKLKLGVPHSRIQVELD